MASSDLEVLVDMGFERERAEMAVKRSGGCRLSRLRASPIILPDEHVLMLTCSSAGGLGVA